MKPETVEQISKAAAQAALEFMEKERARQMKFRQGRRLHNTKLLMRNYRKFKIHSLDNMSELEVLQDPDSLEFLDKGELEIESIIKNKKRTVAMLRYIDRMLQVYRILCEQSKKPEDLRRYQILMDVYVNDDEKTPDDIAKGTFMNKRTVYKDIDKACEALSSLIFGVDGVRVFE